MPTTIHRYRPPGWRMARPSVVAGVFVLFGVAWIVAGEWLAARRLGQQGDVATLQLTKGLLFVAGTGAVLYALLLWRDRALAADRAHLDLLLGQLPGILWTTDEELRLSSVGGSADGALPGSVEELLGRPVHEAATTPEQRAAIEEGHRRALTGEPAEYRLDFRGKSYLSRVEPLRDGSRRIVGCVGFGLEVQGAAALRSDAGVLAAIRHNQGMASLGSLVLAVAHQLKNPLFAISATLDAFEQRAGAAPETARHRAILRQQTERIRVLVTALQEYGQIGEPRRRPTDAARLAARVAADWRGRLEVSGLKLDVNAPAEGEVAAYLDPEAIPRALDRLLENSVHHTPAGGRVRLTARRDDADRLELSVEDSGPGFHPDDLDQATAPLFSRRPGGAGLGLAVAERIVELHGGELTLGTSTLGGAQVMIRLPR